MWIFNRNPEWIGNYWCFLDDSSIEILRVADNGWWRKLDGWWRKLNGAHWSDTGNKEVIAWWEEPKPPNFIDHKCYKIGVDLSNKGDWMKEVIIYEKEEFKELPKRIIEVIIQHAKQGYGCSFISRETGEELSDLALYGLFTDIIDRVLKGIL